MKPGDLVRIRSVLKNSWHLYDNVGMLVEIKEEENLANPNVVLIHGQLLQFNAYDLELVNDGDPSYDIDKDKE
jgi:hypothetical protein